MTTISAGAAAGLLVALMVIATGDVRATEVPSYGDIKPLQPGDARNFNGTNVAPVARQQAR